ncbi:MAG: hypothetical protein CMJ80_08980 [Planctomycetaceae bacterium]|nr:hypothetical protein [Planctomycetaceae bacterium]
MVITQIKFAGSHPVMDNPHLRTQEQIEKLVIKAGRINAAIGVKLMGLQHFLQQPIDPSE